MDWTLGITAGGVHFPGITHERSPSLVIFWASQAWGLAIQNGHFFGILAWEFPLWGSIFGAFGMRVWVLYGGVLTRLPLSFLSEWMLLARWVYSLSLIFLFGMMSTKTTLDSATIAWVSSQFPLDFSYILLLLLFHSAFLCALPLLTVELSSYLLSITH